jgi:hypothetical protein
MAVAVSRWPRRRVAAQVRPHIAVCVLGRPHTPEPPRHPSAPPAPPPSQLYAPLAFYALLRTPIIDWYATPVHTTFMRILLTARRLCS